MPPLLQTWALPAAVLVIVNLSSTWYNVVCEEVPEPYLDEFFHIPQAQKYCRSDYTWDPKITTPPGLYLIAKFLSPVFGCETASLRALNVAALCLICPASYIILRFLRTPSPVEKTPPDIKATTRDSSAYESTRLVDANTALNIALFPPLFFFSALFYTDVISTLLVLLCYCALLKMENVYDEVLAVLFGLMALMFRQTNIFWVAVFPAGLKIISALKKSAYSRKSSKTASSREILQNSWSDGAIHDCAVHEAGLGDYLLLLITAVLAAIGKPLVLLRATLPYLALMLLFAGFVAWNGGVVLGDKTAHTATIHTPQMLYIWPYIAFFSAPLSMTPLLQPLIVMTPQRLRRTYEKYFPGVAPGLPGSLSLLLWFAVGLAAVHFNTIVHPYTLADNRHYVFYVFKILLRHPAFKYMAVPIYYGCAWMTMQALGIPSNRGQDTKLKRDERPTRTETTCPPCQISFIFIWLVTTALSLITAPLVEPRYFIIPWIMWRLHVPTLPASLSTMRNGPTKKVYDLRPCLETLWMLAVNAAVTYIFIRRGFEWQSEPGKVQRFLW